MATVLVTKKPSIWTKPNNTTPSNQITKPVVTTPKPQNSSQATYRPATVTAAATATTSATPTNSGITAYQLSEIQRKAKEGIPLSVPTPEKMAIYNMYREQYAPKPQQPTTTSSNGITAYQLSEIQRKAKEGVPLLVPTPEKMAIYNMYRSQYAPTPQQPEQNVNESQVVDLDELRQSIANQINEQMLSMLNTWQSALPQPQFTDISNMISEEYKQMLQQLQEQLRKLSEELSYYKALQSYWNMYGNLGGLNRNQYSPFL